MQIRLLKSLLQTHYLVLQFQKKHSSSVPMKNLYYLKLLMIKRVKYLLRKTNCARESVLKREKLPQVNVESKSPTQGLRF
ncbi:hypothetical protein GDO78_012672 [Eleutherodactylus coqui]|uniref:Uncharacterized protein n=1 Tax=Eleutherodactylus coqui TaxID=57060 RepID=A0A8J6F2F2_ELECQ|nr:hypothetical protein GDO78_012672 [Eleutherodactylus coqui]